MLYAILTAMFLSACFVEPKQVLYDDKSLLSNDNIKLKDLSNIEHLDNTLRTYQNFARKCRICEFPDTIDQFVCKETPCKTEDDLRRYPIMKKVKSLEPCVSNSIHENSCASCLCDSSGHFLDCTVTKTVPLCLLYMQ